MTKRKIHQATQYGSDQITTLEGIEHIRKRPSMYIRDTGEFGLHHLIRELVDNSVDEAMAGYANKIVVTLYPDGSCQVTDNGRGIPAEIHSKTGISALEMAVSKVFTGGKFNEQSYKSSAGLHGVGIKAVTALSASMSIKSYRDGGVYSQQYRKGVKEADVHFEVSDTENNGTLVRFIPDPTIFETTEWNANTIKERLRELSCLVPKVKFVFRDGRQGGEPVIESWVSKKGLVDLFGHVTPDGKKAAHDPIVVKTKDSKQKIEVELLFGYIDGFYFRHLKSYVNCVATGGGGKHVEGLQSGILDVVRDLTQNDGRLKKINGKVLPEDVMEGTCAIIAVRIPDPKFEGQTKDKLGNTEVRPIIQDAVKESFNLFLQKNPKVCNYIKERAINAVLARDASRKARQAARKKAGPASMPSKLADCLSKDSEHTELILVEGDSAGGSAKDGRDRNTQAILPLKGKVLNVEGKLPSKILGNDEINFILQALGIAAKSERNEIDLDTDNLRYGKVIIATDADSDGSHIICLLLTLFYRLCPQLIMEGRVYLAQPPLFRIKVGSKITYVQDEKSLNRTLKNLEGKKGKPLVTRFKGLGEMDSDVLYETTLDPTKRSLIRVTIDDAEEASKTISQVMGDNVEYRRRIITAQIQELDPTFLT